MSADSPRQAKSDTICSKDSAGYNWEEVTVPTPPTDLEHLVPPAKSTNAEPPKQLCGYLMKQTNKLSLKTWKPRWFVFDETRCCLYYYNEKNDFNPQGKIDISTATLTYEVENLGKHQFEIFSEGRTVSLQASSSEAMIYWLTMLQKKRRKFSTRRHQNRKNTETDQPTTSEANSGLVGATVSQDNLDPPDNEDHIPSNPPTDLEDRQAFVDPSASSVPRRHLSFKLPWPQKAKSSPGSTRRYNFKTYLSSTAEDREGGRIENGDSPLQDEGQSSQLVNSEPQLRENKWGNRMSALFPRRNRPDSAPCPRCEQLQESLSEAESNLKIKEREVQDRDEINEFLRNEIRMCDMRTKAKDELLQAETVNLADKKVDVLLQREQTIEQLQKLLEEAIGEKDRAKTELQAKRQELEILGEQVSLFKEALTAKDHVVVELTNTVFKLEHKGQVPTNPQDAMLPMTAKSYEEEIQRMQETVDAYKQQNRFLSSELAELNDVRTEDMDIYKALENKHHELEAEYYRIQSKHMVLLQESQQPRMGTEAGPDSEVVSQMLEEALKGEEENQVTDKDSSNPYDRYGFSHTHAASDAGHLSNPLTVKVRKLNQQAQRAYDETASSKRDKWDQLIASGKELQRGVELKRLIRGGVPRAHRSKVWKWIIRQNLGRLHVEGQYEAILHQHAGQQSIAVNQIELDLLRTLPTNKYYDKPDAQGINKLRRILVAFSWYDCEVGYCQGLNRLGAIALLFLDEEDAFWCLVCIVHRLLPGDYYSKTLLGSQTDQRVLRDLLQDHAGKLCEHLSMCNIDLSLFTFNWFHTIFVDNLPVETMLRIWDTFLYEGSKVLFRFAIAIFKYNEEDLLLIDNSIGIFNRLRTMCQDATDVNRLVNIAFQEIGGFPQKTITSKRSQYKLEIKAELDALDHLRSQAITPTPTTARYLKVEVAKEERDDDSDVEIEETIYLD